MNAQILRLLPGGKRDILTANPNPTLKPGWGRNIFLNPNTP